MKNKKKINNKSIVTMAIIICSIMGLISLYKIINWYSDTKEVREIKENLSKYVKPKDTTYEIDFKKLKEQNNSVVAYLKVNDTNIDYVVVQGNDNDYYLHHDFNKNPNIAGWVFASYQNKIDGTDKNIVIFGHNMRDASMFGSLKNILNKKWYNNEDNRKITLVTNQGNFIYEVFSIYQIKPEDYYIQTDFNNEKEYKKFLKTIKTRSINNFNVPINKNDNILTLSTCASGGRERLVMHAKKI